VTSEELNIIRGVTTASMANGDIHRRCMEGTRQPILEEVERWRLDPTSPQILWLADVAGSGKSTVAKEMAEKWREQGCLAGKFFFSRDAEETRTPKLFFTTIAQQGLARLGPEVRSIVAAGNSKLIDPVSAMLEEQCSAIFLAPLRMIHVPTILALDALDECEPQACQHLLRIIIRYLPNLPHLKVCMTSRPETHIRAQLSDVAYRELSLRSDDLSSSKDVEFYISHRLNGNWLTAIHKAQLIERAGGLFIWARTVCDLLENFRGNRLAFINRVLSQKVQEMDAIYRIALEQAIGINKAKETIDAYIDVLSTIVAAYEPMTPKMINRLLMISDSMEIVNDLKSVLECRDEDAPIRFLHPTFREFLLNKETCGRYFVDSSVAHNLVARGSLSVLKEELEYDLCKLYGFQELQFGSEQLSQRCLEYTSSTLRYSCSFWASHILLQNECIPPSLISLIEEFFRCKLLDWTYMVGVQGSIDKAFTMLRKLISAKSVR
jgi:hypothetical protein